MRRLVVSTGVIVLVLVALIATMRGRGITAAGHRPWPFEERLARRAWRFMVPAEIRRASNPAPATPDALKDARAHWADHCALCHGNDGRGDTPIGRNLSPRAPDLRAPETQSLSDGELFYIIENGVRFTGMPAWGEKGPHDAEASWQLVHFIRHLSSLSDAERAEMEALNPRSQRDVEEQQEIERFLSGEAPERPDASHPH